MEIIKQQTRAVRVVVWLTGCKPVCADLACSPARQLCLWRTALLQLLLPLVALYKCFAFTFNFY